MKVQAAHEAGRTEIIQKVKTGQAAELGSPAAQAEVPWTPPENAKDLPHMLASELAAMADEGLKFEYDIGF